MGVESEAILSLLIIGAIAVLVLFFLLGILFEEATRNKGEENDQFENKLDDALITQSKAHHRNYSEDFPKKDMDFEVNFNVSLKDSIVKTEVVYAE